MNRRVEQPRSRPPLRTRLVARGKAVYRRFDVRRGRVEARLERRFPQLYDGRHAAKGLGRALWPLLGPLLAALLVVPVLALLAALVAALGLKAPPIDLPSLDLDLPHIPIPSVTAPGWLQAIGEAIDAVLVVVGAGAKYVVAAGALIFGVRRSREVRRKRMAAERVGRRELLRSLAVVLSGVEATARAQDAGTIGGPSIEGRAATPAAASASREGRE